MRRFIWKSFVLLFALLCLGQTAVANDPATFSAAFGSSTSATLLLRADGLASGDEVTARTMQGYEVGSAVVEDGVAVLSIRGDDAWTVHLIEGAAEGDALLLHVRPGVGAERTLPVSGLSDLTTGQPLAALQYETGAVWAASVEAVALGRGEEAFGAAFALEQNYPNPFSGATRIAYQLPRPEHVTLTVYDLMGRRVAVLVDEKQVGGRHEVHAERLELAAGLYLYEVRAGQARQVRRMTVL